MFLKRLHESVTSAAVISAMSRFGEVESINESKLREGFTFVNFKAASSAQRAVQARSVPVEGSGEGRVERYVPYEERGPKGGSGAGGEGRRSGGRGGRGSRGGRGGRRSGGGGGGSGGGGGGGGGGQ